MKNGLVVYRAVLGVDEKEKSLIFAGHVEEKSKVRISAPQGEKINLTMLIIALKIAPLKMKKKGINQI